MFILDTRSYLFYEHLHVWKRILPNSSCVIPVIDEKCSFPRSVKCKIDGTYLLIWIYSYEKNWLVLCIREISCWNNCFCWLRIQTLNSRIPLSTLITHIPCQHARAYITAPIIFSFGRAPEMILTGKAKILLGFRIVAKKASFVYQELVCVNFTYKWSASLI